jgi:hypothetical protein
MRNFEPDLRNLPTMNPSPNVVPQRHRCRPGKCSSIRPNSAATTVAVNQVSSKLPTTCRPTNVPSITTADLAIPNFVLPPRVQDINIPPLLTIVDVVSVSAGVVEWVTITGDPQAAVVAEGAAKPEAVLTYTPTSAPLDTLAHWVQITRQALDDASYIRSVVEGKLRRGLTLAIADAIQDAITAATLPTASAASLLGAIRAGIGTVQSNGYMPNAVVLNPADWAELDMTVMGGTLGGPVVGQTFWGLTVVPSRFQTAGTALVGDFKAGVAWFDRNVSSVFISDSHADLFIKNTLVILAETRGKAAVPEPNALCEATATAHRWQLRRRRADRCPRQPQRFVCTWASTPRRLSTKRPCRQRLTRPTTPSPCGDLT